MESKVWLLMGLGGSLEGVLSATDSSITFNVFKKGFFVSNAQLEKLAQHTGKHNLIDDLENNKEVEILNISINRIEKIEFPWISFGAAMNLTIEGIKYKFSLLQPQNTILNSENDTEPSIGVITNIKQGRKLGKELKKLLLDN
jgi:hypothetical protein